MLQHPDDPRFPGTVQVYRFAGAAIDHGHDDRIAVLIHGDVSDQPGIEYGVNDLTVVNGLFTQLPGLVACLFVYKVPLIRKEFPDAQMHVGLVVRTSVH